MLDFHKFKEIFQENIFSLNKQDDSIIIEEYELFNNSIRKSEQLAFSFLEREGVKLPDDPISNMLNDARLGIEYRSIITESAKEHLEVLYGNERLDDSGMCLISNLIGKACQMIHNEELLGVVRGYDKEHPKLLIIDFGDPEEVKVDIDELIIQGQKKY